MSARGHMDRRALFASGAAAALLAATGLSAQPRPEQGGRLRVALSGAARSDSFDMRKPQGLFMQVAAAGAVFDTLTEIAADGTVRGELATGWQAQSDGAVWTFDLRREVQFHNGRPFTAEDVVSSYRLHQDGALADIASFEVLDTHRLRMTLTHPDAGLPLRLSAPDLVIYPARDLQDAMQSGIGTGLYRTHRFLPGRQFIGQRVERHYKDGRAGWFDSIELVSIPAGQVRAQALEERLVDAADIDDGALLALPEDFVLLPETQRATHAVHHSVALPGQIGSRWPLDNLRAAERWWMA